MVFTQKQLEEAFSKIRPEDDWRDPIYSVIHKDDYMIMKAACLHFTATSLNIVNQNGDMLTVEAVGYRDGPAGPCLDIF